jgi:N-acetylmuramoyl-L-alanine amidase
MNHSHSHLVRGPRVFVPKAYPEAAASEPRRWERAAGQRSAQARDLAGEFSKILARTESARVTVQSLNLAPFKGMDMPAVLIELGFLSHAESRERLLDPAYRRQMASSLAEAVLAWRGRQAHARAEGEP